MGSLRTIHFDMLSLRENMKPTKTKTTRLFKMMDITEKQLKQAIVWYQQAKSQSDKQPQQS